MSDDEFMQEFSVYCAKYTKLRKGQALMTFLWQSGHTELYDMITGTDYDCFYDDKRYEQTLQYVMNNLE